MGILVPVGNLYKVQLFVQYISGKKGPMVDVDTGQELSSHEGIHLWTVGQRLFLQGQSKACYVCEIDASTNTIYVVSAPFRKTAMIKLSFTLIYGRI